MQHEFLRERERDPPTIYNGFKIHLLITKSINQSIYAKKKEELDVKGAIG